MTHPFVDVYTMSNLACHAYFSKAGQHGSMTLNGDRRVCLGNNR